MVAPAMYRCLTNPALDPKEEFADPFKKISGAYNFVHRMTRLFYDPHSLTRAQAGADGKTHKDHESAMAAGHYMLSGDSFENYETFNTFFEIPDHPDHFRCYKKLVIDRKEFVHPSCHTPWDTVFLDICERDKERQEAPLVSEARRQVPYLRQG